VPDPVVACDGHSYERSAILDVIRSGNGLSPLTREPLNDHLFSNRNLKKRIELYEEEVLSAAAAAVANAIAAATENGEASSESSNRRRREASSADATPAKRARVSRP
jgi:hypothetical protein